MADRGRPTIYTEDLGREICERLAEGQSLRSVAKDDKMPNRSTMISWALDSDHDFSDRYRRAREIQAECLSDDIFDIADDGANDFVPVFGEESEIKAYQYNGEHVNRSKLRVDARKWYLGRIVPRFKDKSEVAHTGDPVINLTLNKE